MASISDVAEKAGVSTASVSRVLSGQTVRDEVREKVLSAVKALNYRPNRAARSLRSSKTTTLGLIVADIQNTYFTQVCRAVEDAAAKRGYAVFLCNSDENPDKEKTYLRLMRDENVAGVILAPTAEILRSLSDETEQMPLVVIDRPNHRLPIDTVIVDNRLAGMELTEHLLSHGRKKIAGIFGAHSATGRERYEGFKSAHESRKVKIVDSLVKFVSPREQVGFETVQELLKGKELPDAILTSNGLLAAGAFRAIGQSKLKCPEQIAFASFDDTTWATLVSPPITVIEQPTYEIGRTATEMLLDNIQNRERSPRLVTLPHRLIVRQSCGCAGLAQR